MIFVDQLTVSLALHVLPHAIGERLKRRDRPLFVYFSSSPKGNHVFNICRRLSLVDTEEADYSYLEVMASDGNLALERVQTRDAFPLLRKISAKWLDSDRLINSFSRRKDRERLMLFLAKALERELNPTLMRVNIAAYINLRNNGSEGEPPLFITKRSLWFVQLSEYATAHAVALRGYRALSWPLRLPATQTLVSLARITIRMAGALFSRKPGRAEPSTTNNPTIRSSAPTVAVPFSGRGLSLEPDKNSDLFWVPYANLSPAQLLLYATRRDSPLTDDNVAYLRKSGIRAIATKKRSSKTGSAPNWPAPRDVRGLLREVRGQWALLAQAGIAGTCSFGVRRWVAHQLFEFVTYYVYWRWFFTQFGVKVHVDPAETGKQRVSADQAIADLGGVSISYQRSFEEFFSIRRASALDVHFAFSPSWAELESMSGSTVYQFVANGYLYDHAFSKTGERAAEIRRRLIDHGAKYIVCFLDQNSVPNKKNGPSHEQRSEDYRELLERLLSDPEIGLIFKPKKPSDLRQRLGEVGELLDAAMETGRCYMYQEGNIATDAFPCEASAAADVTIALIFGSTAAMESALAGTPTLVLDRETVGYHPLHALGDGTVVFTNWPDIWESLSKHRSDPGSVPGLGDWNPMLQRLDGFQDGRAAERMGQYIAWLCEAYESGLGRDDALAFAKNRYVGLWGADTITDIRAHHLTASAGQQYGVELTTWEPQL